MCRRSTETMTPCWQLRLSLESLKIAVALPTSSTDGWEAEDDAWDQAVKASEARAAAWSSNTYLLDGRHSQISLAGLEKIVNVCSSSIFGGPNSDGHAARRHGYCADPRYRVRNGEV